MSANHVKTIESIPMDERMIEKMSEGIKDSRIRLSKLESQKIPLSGNSSQIAFLKLHIKSLETAIKRSVIVPTGSSSEELERANNFFRAIKLIKKELSEGSL